jgi:DNA-binding NarL/FixJ family response regulator
MKLLIIGNRVIVREGVKALLLQVTSGTTVLQASTCAEGLAIADLNPNLDAVLLDLAMPNIVGIGAIEEFGRQCPNLPIVVLCASEEPQTVRRVLALGALGYIPKTSSPRTLMSALQFVIEGNVYVPPFILEGEPAAPLNGQAMGPRNGGSPLTQRQTEVVKLVDVGLSNKEISRRLGLSEKTVKVHISAIFRSLRVVNRTQAVNVARQNNLI